MNTQDNESIDLIDLGAASTETQGGGMKFVDIIAYQDVVGLSDD